MDWFLNDRYLRHERVKQTYMEEARRELLLFSTRFYQVLGKYIKFYIKSIFHFGCFPADLFSQEFFQRLFPGVVFWEAFFLGEYKLLVLINVLFISSLSFTFYIRGNFSWDQFYLIFIRGGNFPGGFFPEAFFQTSFYQPQLAAVLFTHEKENSNGKFL